jgi:hypothetical protein
VIIVDVNGRNVYLDKYFQGHGDHIAFERHPGLVYPGDPRYEQMQREFERQEKLREERLHNLIFPDRPAYKFEFCFSAGTPVACPGGFRPIEEIRRGDTVLVWHPSEGRLMPTSVTELDMHEGCFDLLTIRFSTGETLKVTPEHPFYQRGKWVASTEFAKSGTVVGAIGIAEMTGTATLRREYTMVYNLQTETGTYLVGRAGLLVSGRTRPSAEELLNATSALGDVDASVVATKE